MPYSNDSAGVLPRVLETASAASRDAVPCEVCGGPARHAFDARGYPMFRCAACPLVFTSPPPPAEALTEIYADDYFAGRDDGAGYPDYVAEGPMLRKRGLGYGRLLSRYAVPGRVLDVGAAAGFVLQGYADAGWTGVGIELNASMASYGRGRLGLDVRTGALEGLGSSECFDAVSFLQVAAHFTHPREALARAAELTSPGGLWLFETWNCASLTARAFGRNWHAYAPPSAVRALSPRALDALVRPFGFVPVERGTPRKVIDARHAKFVLATLAKSSRLAAAARRLLGIVPDRTQLVYLAEDVFWTLYRRERGPTRAASA